MDIFIPMSRCEDPHIFLLVIHLSHSRQHCRAPIQHHNNLTFPLHIFTLPGSLPGNHQDPSSATSSRPFKVFIANHCFSEVPAPLITFQTEILVVNGIYKEIQVNFYNMVNNYHSSAECIVDEPYSQDGHFQSLRIDPLRWTCTLKTCISR